jgi:hypothetical protein
MAILATAQSVNDYCMSNQQLFGGSVVTDIMIQNTTVANFDSTSVSYALTLYNAYVVRVIKPLPTAGTVYWTHVMYVTTSLTGSATLPDMMAYVSDDETPLVRFNKVTASGNTYQVQLLQGATLVTLAGTFTLPVTSLRELDFKWQGHSTTGNIEVYDNQTLIYSFTGNTLVDADIKYVVFGGSNSSGSVTSAVHISEVIVADEPTLRMKLRNLKVSTVDSATNWTTSLGKVIGTGGGVSIDHALPGNFSTSPGTLLFNMSDIPAADTAKRIRTVVVTKFISRTGITPIAGTRTVLDISGTLYETANHDLFGDSDNIQIEYLNNPATSQPWTFTEVNALKVGVKSV